MTRIRRREDASSASSSSAVSSVRGAPGIVVGEDSIACSIRSTIPASARNASFA
jgi:hypothetical protein